MNTLQFKDWLEKRRTLSYGKTALKAVNKLPQEVKDNTIILIGPMGAGKSSTAKVLRDGNLTIVASKELVPGDIVVLETGDFVPADLRIIEEANLKSQESSLTGESVPVEKSIQAIKEEKVGITKQKKDEMILASSKIKGVWMLFIFPSGFPVSSLVPVIVILVSMFYTRRIRVFDASSSFPPSI